MDIQELQSAIDRVRAGDIEAFTVIVNAYQPDVWRTVAFAMRNFQATEELVQQAFVNAYLNLDRFEPGRDFGPWLRTIARNLVREELRRQARTKRRLEAYRRHWEVQMDGPQAADEHEAALSSALSECRGKLSDLTRKAFKLRYEQAMDFQELGRHLGRTTAGARQLLQRARLLLRACIERRMADITMSSEGSTSA